MKKMIKNLLLGSTLFVLPMTVFAQDKEIKKEKIRVRVEKNVDGKKEVREETIDASGMNQAQKEVLIEKLQDSLANGSDKKMKQMKITIEDEGDMMENDEHLIIRRSPKGDDRKLEYHIERFGDKVRELGDELPRRFDFRGPAYTWDDQLFAEGKQAPSIRNIEVFPNKPESETLNIRFMAAEKGDIAIKVLDIDGKIVEKKDIKDFMGEYVGQIQLNKNIKGTFFVLITQNNDGTVRRVVVE